MPHRTGPAHGHHLALTAPPREVTCPSPPAGRDICPDGSRLDDRSVNPHNHPVEPSRPPSTPWPPWGHALAAWSLGLSLTGVFTLVASRDAHVRELERFHRLAEGHAGFVDAHIESYRGALLRLADHIALNRAIGPVEWSRCIERLQLAENFPSFREIGFAAHLGGLPSPGTPKGLPLQPPAPCDPPDHPDCRQWIVVFASGSQPDHFLAPGAEFACDPVLQKALARPDPLQPWITRPRILPGGIRGLTLLQPVVAPSSADAKPTLLGYVYGSFEFDRLLNESLDWSTREVALEVFESPAPDPESRWNNQPPVTLQQGNGWSPRIRETFQRHRYAGIAFVRVSTTPLFDRASLRLRALFIGCTGFLLSTAIAAIVLVQTRGRRRAEALTAELTESRALLRQESERRERLSRDIHDETIQDLYVAGLGLARLRSQVRTEPKAVAQLDASRSTLESVMRRLRGFLVEIDPGPASPEQLVPALSRLIEQLQRTTDATLQLSVPPDLADPIPAEPTLEILHFVREATFNALRHAQPSRVQIHIQATPTTLTAVVEDDGRGFDPATATSRGGFGLHLLQKRAQTLGGTLTVQTQTVGSTRLVLSLPRIPV